MFPLFFFATDFKFPDIYLLLIKKNVVFMFSFSFQKVEECFGLPTSNACHHKSFGCTAVENGLQNKTSTVWGPIYVVLCVRKQAFRCMCSCRRGNVLLSSGQVEKVTESSDLRQAALLPTYVTSTCTIAYIGSSNTRLHYTVCCFVIQARPKPIPQDHLFCSWNLSV